MVITREEFNRYRTPVYHRIMDFMEMNILTDTSTATAGKIYTTYMSTRDENKVLERAGITCPTKWCSLILLEYRLVKDFQYYFHEEWLWEDNDSSYHMSNAANVIARNFARRAVDPWFMTFIKNNVDGDMLIQELFKNRFDRVYPVYKFSRNAIELLEECLKQ